MRLSHLLGATVVDMRGEFLGTVTDVRLVRDGPVLGEFGAAFRIDGLVVGRTLIGAHLGFDRRKVRGPVLLRWLFRLVQGNPSYADWTAVRSIEEGVIRIQPGPDGLPRAEPTR